MRKIVTLFICSLFTTLYSFSQSNGLRFDGVNDYVAIPEKAGMVAGGSFSVETWVKLTGTLVGMQPIMSKNVSNPYFLLSLEEGQPPMFPWEPAGPDMLKFYFFVGSAGNSVQYVLPASWTDQWHHVAATYDGTTLYLYVDGVLAGSSFANGAGSYPLNSMSVDLGRYGTYAYFNGVLDDVRFWNTARTATQIQGSMNTELPPGTSNLVAYYKLNQGTVDGNNASQTQAIDAVAANNGTLTNFALSGSTSNFTQGYLSLTVLPLKEGSFSAVEKQGRAEMIWKAMPSQTDGYFVVERSTDGRAFTAIAQIPFAASPEEKTFSYIDYQPVSPVGYYRIKSVDVDNQPQYSKIVTVQLTGSDVTLKAYPNPAITTLFISVKAPKGTCLLEVRDASGRTVKSQSIVSNGNIQKNSLDVSSLSKGIYLLVVNGSSLKFVKE